MPAASVVVMEIKSEDATKPNNLNISTTSWKPIHEPRKGHLWFIARQRFATQYEAQRFITQEKVYCEEVCRKAGTTKPYISICKAGKEQEFLSPLSVVVLSQGVISSKEFIKAKEHAKTMLERSWTNEALSLYTELRAKIKKHQCQIAQTDYQLSFIEFKIGYIQAITGNIEDSIVMLQLAQQSLEDVDWDKGVRELKAQIFRVLASIYEFKGDKHKSNQLRDTLALLCH